jgi:geranylgeranyl pyrophosphate synthase
MPVRRLREIGGMLGRSARSETALRDGFNLGIAFQIIDDLLDVTGDAGRAGQAGRQRFA